MRVPVGVSTVSGVTTPSASAGPRRGCCDAGRGERDAGQQREEPCCARAHVADATETRRGRQRPRGGEAAQFPLRAAAAFATVRESVMSCTTVSGGTIEPMSGSIV